MLVNYSWIRGFGIEYQMVINMSIRAHEKMGLELKNRSLKKSKVVIGIRYASGEKKFNLQDNFKLSSVAPSGL